MSINKVCISGNLGRDPELKVTQGGTQVCSFPICVNDRKKDGDKWVDVPNWVDVTFFGNRAESIHKFLAKGMLVFVSGRLHQNSWENKDGQKRSKLEVIGDDIQFGSGNRPQQNAPQQAHQQPAQPEYGYQEQASPDVYDEDIPF